MKVPEELQFMVNSRFPQKRTAATMENRVCSISGSTSGVGLEAAWKLAVGSAEIVMLVRNRDTAERVRESLIVESGAHVDYVLAV